MGKLVQVQVLSQAPIKKATKVAFFIGATRGRKPRATAEPEASQSEARDQFAPLKWPFLLVPPEARAGGGKQRS